MIAMRRGAMASRLMAIVMAAGSCQAASASSSAPLKLPPPSSLSSARSPSSPISPAHLAHNPRQHPLQYHAQLVQLRGRHDLHPAPHRNSATSRPHSPGQFGGKHFSMSSLSEFDVLYNASNLADEPWLLTRDEEGIPMLALIFLVFGFIVMSIAAVFTLVLAVRYDGEIDQRPMGPIYYYIMFFVASISALVYYSMWSETSVVRIKEDGQTHILFPARYLDWAITSPLMLIALSLLGDAPLPAIVGIVGCDMLNVSCLFFGAFYGYEHKFFWWATGLIFFAVLLFMLFQELSKASELGRVSEYDANTLRWLTYIFAACWAVFPVVWLVGQTGTSTTSFNVEMAFEVLADVVVKLSFILILIVRLPADGASQYSIKRDMNDIPDYGSATKSGGWRGNLTSSTFV